MGMCGCGTQAVGVISCAIGSVIMFEWRTQQVVVNVTIHTHIYMYISDVHRMVEQLELVE